MYELNDVYCKIINKNNKVKIFISGSRSIKYNEKVNELLDFLKDKNIKILVGDCYGIDNLIRKGCIKRDIECEVYYIGNRRDNDNLKGIKCRGFNFSDKDKVMSYECDFGIVFWDNISKGSLNNIERLKRLGKEVFVNK